MNLPSRVAPSSLSIALALLLGCGGDGEAGDQDNASGVDASTGGSAAICDSAPTRLIVVGDSIAACDGVGGMDAPACGPKQFHTFLDGGHVPGIGYENKAISGSVTAEVTNPQLGTVSTGPGHALVLIYVGGNDIRSYLTASDDQATSGFAADMPRLQGEWATILAFFADSANFPDGATVMMNNQYNPFDDCTAPPYNMSATKIDLFRQYNNMLAEIANGHDNVSITDQHTSYLGHGHHSGVASCPHYDASKEGWMNDLIHPNGAGHANLALQWQATADELFGSCQ